MRIRSSAVIIGFAAALLPGIAASVEADWTLKLKLGGLFEGRRDLGLADADKITEGFADVQPALHLQFSPDFASYFRIQGYGVTGEVVEKEQDVPVREESFAALREAWFEYGGITSYPGEVLRFGLQRVRDPDGEWFDRDVESVRWIFDTTLIQAYVGVAEQFDYYRTDDVELSSSQKDRAYAFAAFGGQWFPGNYAGVRVAYAKDHGDEPAPGATPTVDDKLQERTYTWVGLHVDNGYYAMDSQNLFSYWLEGIGLFGSEDDTSVDPVNNVVTGTVSRDVSAFGGDAGLRWRVSHAFPLQLGAAFAYGGGGNNGDGDVGTFHQTGLQSNRSRFTGTRALIYRFNEALEADMDNLSVFTAYVSLPLDRWDMSLVGHHFRRNDDSESISTGGIDVEPLREGDPAAAGASLSDIGNGADFVLTRYFDIRGAEYTPGEDVRDNVRIRASMFMPGDAYGSDLENQYLIVLETTLWF